jgi:hypothetical protein
MDHHTDAINLRALRRLHKPMFKHQPKELKRMIADDPGVKMNDTCFGGRNGGELGTLQKAHSIPTLFPVHILADDDLVRLIKRVHSVAVGSLWVTAAQAL